MAQGGKGVDEISEQLWAMHLNLMDEGDKYV